MAEERTKKGMPFWLQIAAILFAGVAVSIAIVFLARTDQKQAPSVEGSGEEHTVTFAYSDGTVIASETVEDGKGVFPPILETQDVFRGWSGPINAVTKDTEVHPEIYHIVEDNLFYFNSVYVQEGTEFDLPVMISGNVNVSSGELYVEYDPDVLKFESADGQSWCDVSKPKKGVLKIKFRLDSVLDEPTELTKLSFTAKEKDVYSTQLNLRSENVVVFSDQKEVPADNATINNKVFYLQEVG